MDRQFPASIKTMTAVLLNWDVDDQYELAKKLAANCGYRLVTEDNDRSLEIKDLIARVHNNDPILDIDRRLIKQGLEKLL